MGRRNPIAKALRVVGGPRIVKPKKGRGAVVRPFRYRGDD